MVRSLISPSHSWAISTWVLSLCSLTNARNFSQSVIFCSLLDACLGDEQHIACFWLALKPQIDCVATDVAQLTRNPSLESAEFERLHYYNSGSRSCKLLSSQVVERLLVIVGSPNSSGDSYMCGKCGITSRWSGRVNLVGLPRLSVAAQCC